MNGTWESPSGFLANIPKAGATAAGAGAGMPWSAILPIVISLLSGIGGESEEDKRRREMMELDQMMRQYGLGKYSQQSRMQEMMQPRVLQAVINQLSRMKNWGYPAGMGMDLSFLENLNLPGMGGVQKGMGSGIRRSVTPSVLGG